MHILALSVIFGSCRAECVSVWLCYHHELKNACLCHVKLKHMHTHTDIHIWSSIKEALLWAAETIADSRRQTDKGPFYRKQTLTSLCHPQLLPWPQLVKLNSTPCKTSSETRLISSLNVSVIVPLWSKSCFRSSTRLSHSFIEFDESELPTTTGHQCSQSINCCSGKNSFGFCIAG